VARLADRVISLSESTLRDFIFLTGARKDKVSVVHLGVDWTTSSFPNERAELVRKKYGIDGKYLLFVGMIEPRKNVANLILAYDKLLKVNKNYQLVIVGKKGWDYRQVFNLIDDLSLHDKIIFTGFVEEEDKPFIIRGAKIFVYPSIYEGFGMPVLEALSLGIPTVTSNVSSLPEITGGAALLVDPANVDELYSGIKRLLDDETIYQELKKKAVLQARKFSWMKTAQKTIELYKSTGA
jgi:glycosyltransferase involved in cell wall biosynthesis